MITGTLTDPLQELDFGADACCTLQFVVNSEPFCTQPAAWASRLGCCGHIKVVCDYHRDIATAVAPKIFVCNRCRATRPPILSTWPV